MLITPPKILISLLFFALPGLAHAFNLGELHSRTEIGQALDAYIDLYLGPGERHLPFAVSLSHDIFSDRYRQHAQTIQAIQASVEHQAGGYSFIHLHGDVPSSATPLRFRLRIEHNGRSLNHHYTFTARPVTPPRRVARRVLPLATIAHPTVGDHQSSYGPVRAGDNVWSIARRVARGDPTLALMKAIHAANPTAFIHGDINRLKVGVTLSIPASNVQRPSSPVIDAKILGETTANIATEPDLRKAMPTSAFEDLSDPFAEGLAASAESATDGLVLKRDPELTAKLAALDEKYAAIRAKYSHPTPAAPAVVDAAIDYTAPPSSQMASKGQPSIPATTAPVPLVAAPVSITAPTPASVASRDAAPATSGQAASDRAMLAFMAAASLSVLLFVLLGLLFVVSRLTRGRRHREQVHAASILEADRKAAVAQKAEQRVRMESQIREKLGIKMESTSSTSNGSLVLAQSAPPLVTAVPSTLESDIDIDSSIAHGRYLEAERLLREVIATTPRNVSAKMRLAEVYYITERVADFSELAIELQRNYRADLSSDEWQRLRRMGKIVAPELAMFSGPRAVERGA